MHMAKVKPHISFEPVVEHNSQTPTPVEQNFLHASKRHFQYNHERVPSIEVPNSMELGKLTALRFLEWLSANPDGVVALPTGKSPEFFIKFLGHYKAHWKESHIQKELHSYGITSATFPDTTQLKFVQLDEFFPIDPAHENSFYTYVNRYYLPLLGIKPKNALLINPAQISNVEQFCRSYEQKINAWGGIGFFLGGIGADGHIAFNVAGSSANSLTRLVTLNYESACGAARGLGGMAYARNKTVITIGLDTIIRKKDATIIIIAAGQGKAPMVAHAIEQEDMHYPAAVLQKNSGTRFYLTHGAASHLHDRYLENIQTHSDLLHDTQSIDRILTHTARAVNKPIAQLTREDLGRTDDGALLAAASSDIAHLAQESHQRFVQKITSAIPHQKSILHTAPHHDDVMLSYHSITVASLAQNKNHVAYATSAFNAVTNIYIRDSIAGMNHRFISQHTSIIFAASYHALLEKFAHAYQEKNDQEMQLTEQLMVAQLLATIYRCRSIKDLITRVNWIQNSYLKTIRPGEKDDLSMQMLKGAIRETEVNRMWHIHGLSTDHISHVRTKFYTGDYFTPRPTFKHDVTPMLKLLEKHTPDIVTLAFDPEGTGPDTHYKVLQVMAEAVRAWGKQPEIWGYRNVWHRFQPQDATLMAPVSEKELDYLHDIFMHCFSTQKEAAFPSHFHDGPFSELSVSIQKEQLQTMKTILGAEFFAHHADEKIRTAAGFCFIKKMTTEEFLAASERLWEYTEMVG